MRRFYVVVNPGWGELRKVNTFCEKCGAMVFLQTYERKFPKPDTYLVDCGCGKHIEEFVDSKKLLAETTLVATRLNPIRMEASSLES